jgi:hypothetical protein
MLPAQKFITASVTTIPEGKIIIPPILQVKQGIMMLMYDHPTAGHPGQDKMLCKI